MTSGNFNTILQKFFGDERSKLEKICAFSDVHLRFIKRMSGENYSAHGADVAMVLSEGVKNASLTGIALLHDLPLHKDGEKLLTESPLTANERNSVAAMNRLRKLHIDSDTQDLSTFVDAISEESQLIPLRIAHRLNDVRNLRHFVPEMREKIAHESLHMYCAIAGRFGIHKWKYEMEDICFRMLHKDTADSLEKKFRQFAKLDNASLSQTVYFLKKKFREADIQCKIEARIKTLYSTYRKMLSRNRMFEELTDRLAARIIVTNADDCYRALGVVHKYMHPIAGKLKDYIGMPKENGYKSIHTVIYPLPGVTEQPIEIQIRTEEMHEICEYGVPSHGEYKNNKYSLKTKFANVNLVKNFQLLGVKGRSPAQFEETLRTYFNENKMAIFDSKNNLYHVKRPANILDFLCILHYKKLDKISRIRLNGKTVGVDAELRDGDIVEAEFSERRSIKPDWIKLCKHDESIKKIKDIMGYKPSIKISFPNIFNIGKTHKKTLND